MQNNSTTTECTFNQFPGEEKAIEKYFRLLDNAKGIQTALTIFKFIPLWISKFLIRTGLIHKVTGQNM